MTTHAPADRVQYHAESGVGVIALNRPEKRNALDAATVAALAAAFRAAGGDAGVRVILLRGNGPDFCAGADLAALERLAASADPIENLDDAAGLGELFILMRRLEKPIVAAVHGHAFAGGAGLATGSDIVLAAESASFGYPEIHLGFVPAMVMALLRRSTGEKVAFELLARGDRIPASEAHRLGLVTRILPSATFQDDAAEYARELASRSGSALRLVKRLFYGIDSIPFDQAIARGAEMNALARTTADCRTGVRRFLDSRRAPR